MPTNIKCPKCSSVFNVDDVLAADVEQKFQKQFEQRLQESRTALEEEKKRLTQEQQAFEEKRKKENELFTQKLQQEKLKMESEMQVQIRKSISEDYENKLRLLTESDREKEEKLKTAQKKELEFLRKEQDLKNRETELELEVQKKLMLERNKLQDVIRKEEEHRISIKEEEHRFKVKELEKQLEDQRKLTEEMKRKQEQGSMQLQGEVQELLLEDLLKNSFPFDMVSEVGKGVRGADCIHTVRNNFGQECGKIIYESKRTKDFSIEWIEKLKKDMRQTGCDIAVIVTNVMPKDMDCFGLKDGVWICCFGEVKAMANVLRDGIIRVYNSAKSHENKGDKVHLLYSYLTSTEFSEQWKAIREGFLSMKISIQKERDAMEKLWKAREKYLEKVLLSAAHIKGSIEGIAGHNLIDFDLADGEEEEELPTKYLFK